MPITVATNLTPPAISQFDYSLVQAPAQGGEKEVFLSAEPSFYLGIILMTGTGQLRYEAINAQYSRPLTGTLTCAVGAVTGTGTKFMTEVSVGDLITIDGQTAHQVTAVASDLALTIDGTQAATDKQGRVYPAWPIVAVVLNDLKADAAAKVTLQGLTADIKPVSYSSNQTFNFPASRGVELIGPQTDIITVTSVPTVTAAKRGARIGIVQLPPYSSFRHVGDTTSKDIAVPVKTAKAISRGMDTSRYVKPGKTTEGKLKISARDMGADEGIARFLGVKCVAMLETMSEEQVLRERQFMTSYVPNANQTNPDAEAESGLECDGAFQHMITLPAPGGA
jgi:hypothetical protein